MTKKERLESTWEATRALWFKYCGVADEYKMLRDRWAYLYDGVSLPILPDLKETTFRQLDNLLYALNENFGELGFDRSKIENFEEFGKRFKTIEDFESCSNIYREIRDETFFDLATYVGLLKLAFFQRTVSSEISHVASGIPRSPERTIGNELFYIAADNVAKSYFTCLNVENINWDGFVTFAPPKESTGFYGAFFRASKHLPLFHVSMSEEQKYFVGAYPVLAHEFGHAALNDRWERFLDLYSFVIQSFYSEHRGVLGLLRQELPIESLELFSSRKCVNCPFYPTLDGRQFIGIFNELLSDIIAIHIGGINTTEAYFNEIFLVSPYLLNKKRTERGTKIRTHILRKEAIIRLSGILAYLKEIGYEKSYIDRLESRLDNCIDTGDDIVNLVDDRTKKGRVKLHWEEWIVLRDVCIECLLKIGEIWGSIIGKLDKKALREAKKSIFSDFVKEERFFNIKKGVEGRIVKSLLNGETCIDEEPHYILHAYYEAYKQSTGEERPHYGATIHSLAFNKYKSKRD